MGRGRGARAVRVFDELVCASAFVVDAGASVGAARVSACCEIRGRRNQAALSAPWGRARAAALHMRTGESRARECALEDGERRVEFENARGERLAGVVREAPGDESRDVVVVCHGFRSSKEGRVVLAVARALTGKASLRFDFSGNGESEGEFMYGNYAAERADLCAAVEFVRKKLGREVCAVVGHSKGGNAVLLYGALRAKQSAAASVPPLAVVNVCGRIDMTRGINERLGGSDTVDRLRRGELSSLSIDDGRFGSYLVTRASLEERLALDMRDELSHIARNGAAAGLRVLTVHGSDDQVVPVSDAYTVHDELGDGLHTLKVVKGADHRFTSPDDLAALVTETLLFIESHR
mmetsp:Transcript_13786/g.36996  ORF Transcript_13786/g.36996 Transcript_13786/m.36996 type:complete len:351 (+) Transcript_13786:237-1289(+)